MEKITIMRSVVVKQIITENFKTKAAAEIQESLKKAEFDLDHYDKNTKKTITELTLKGHPQVNQIKQQVEAEKQKLNAYKQQLVDRLKVISKLNLGEEIIQGTIDGPLEVQVGDNFEALNGIEMVIKDGIIIEIRKA
ncbi:MAG: YlqD family protein [Peptococcaceae bacterium]